MKSGKCPKCGSNQIYKKNARGHRSYILTGIIRFVRLADYVCAGCGYVESYLYDEKHKEHIKNNWEKVQPR